MLKGKIQLLGTQEAFMQYLNKKSLYVPTEVVAVFLKYMDHFNYALGELRGQLVVGMRMPGMQIRNWEEMPLSQLVEDALLLSFGIVKEYTGEETELAKEHRREREVLLMFHDYLYCKRIGVEYDLQEVLRKGERGRRQENYGREPVAERRNARRVLHA